MTHCFPTCHAHGLDLARFQFLQVAGINGAEQRLPLRVSSCRCQLSLSLILLHYEAEHVVLCIATLRGKVTDGDIG